MQESARATAGVVRHDARGGASALLHGLAVHRLAVLLTVVNVLRRSPFVAGDCVYQLRTVFALNGLRGWSLD